MLHLHCTAHQSPQVQKQPNMAVDIEQKATEMYKWPMRVTWEGQ